jgi:hypothetical protein
LDRREPQYAHRILPCTALLTSQGFLSWRDGLDDWLREHQPDSHRAFRDKWRDPWTKAVTDFQTFEVPLVELPRVADNDRDAIGRVCAIFEKLNSTGVEEHRRDKGPVDGTFLLGSPTLPRDWNAATSGSAAPPPGTAFDSGSVQWVRFSAGLTSFKERLVAAGMLTGKQIAAQLGVRRTTIGRWRRAGRLTARICNEMGEWLYAPQQNVHPTARVRANAPHRVARTTLLQEVQYER